MANVISQDPRRGTTPIRWNPEIGRWRVYVAASRPLREIRALAGWAFKANLDRWRSLPPGDRKDDLKRALQLLARAHREVDPVVMAGLIEQVVVTQGDVVLFNAEAGRERKPFVDLGGK